MLSRRTFLMSTVAAGRAAVAGLPLGMAAAQEPPQLQIFVPAAPGGGWDQTARTMDQVLRSEKLISGAQITNVGGAGGTVGLPQFVNQWKGKPNALMIAGMVMVGAIIANKSPVNLTQTTPIAQADRRIRGSGRARSIPLPNRGRFCRRTESRLRPRFRWLAVQPAAPITSSLASLQNRRALIRRRSPTCRLPAVARRLQRCWAIRSRPAFPVMANSPSR